jgi:hypothetical protein
MSRAEPDVSFPEGVSFHLTNLVTIRYLSEKEEAKREKEHSSLHKRHAKQNELRNDEL